MSAGIFRQRARQAWTCTSFVICVVVPVSDQQSEPRQPNQNTGHGQISGIVLTAEPVPKPVRRAVVTVSAESQAFRPSAITEDDGTFVLDSIASGRYSVIAAKPGFVSIPYGATAPDRPGRTLVVNQGENPAGLVLQLLPGAAVSGTIRSQDGEPLADVQVTLLRRDKQGDWTATAQVMRTTERGVYRGFGVDPGEYLVLARNTGLMSRPTAVPTSSEIQSNLDALQRGEVLAPQAVNKLFQFVPTLYPNVRTITQAVSVFLQPGLETSGVDLTLQRVLVTSVEGSVIAPSGANDGQVDVSLIADDTIGMPPSRVPVGRNGSFRFENVPSGRYVLLATTRNFTTRPDQKVAGTSGVEQFLWALGDVNIADLPVYGVRLSLQRGLRLGGRVDFDGNGQKPGPEAVDLRVIPVRGRLLSTGLVRLAQTFRATLKPGGEFEVGGLMPGEYRFSVGVLSSAARGTWTLRAIDLNGTNILDGRFALTSENAAGSVRVLMTDKRSSLAGRLLLATNSPALDYYIVVFPTDRTAWGRGSRRVAAARPRADGEYSFQELPPGEYYVAALIDIVSGEWDQPAFLEKLVSSAIRVTVDEAQNVRQDLRIDARYGKTP